MTAPVKITVCFFAALREQLDCSQIQQEIAPNSSVKDLLQQLQSENPHWQAPLTQSSLLMAVNHNMANEQTLLNDGDEVAFFPPVTGG